MQNLHMGKSDQICFLRLYYYFFPEKGGILYPNYPTPIKKNKKTMLKVVSKKSEKNKTSHLDVINSTGKRLILY